MWQSQQHRYSMLYLCIEILRSISIISRAHKVRHQNNWIPAARNCQPLQATVPQTLHQDGSLYQPPFANGSEHEMHVPGQYKTVVPTVPLSQVLHSLLYLTRPSMHGPIDLRVLKSTPSSKLNTVERPESYYRYEVTAAGA
jgi:hypothetical protein